jgi:hypothetical protein
MTTTTPTYRDVAAAGAATVAPGTIAEIPDPRLRAAVGALVAAVEELETDPAETRTVEQAWADMDDDRDIALAAAQAVLVALDELAATGGDR